MKKLITILALAGGMSASVAHAHGYWVLPSSTVLSTPQFVTFDAAVSNDPFHFNHRPLMIDALAILAPDGSKVAPVNVSKGELRTTFDAKLEQEGTYRLEIVRAGFRASWKENGQPKRFMGDAEGLKKEIPATAQELQVTEQVNRLETFVTVGKPTAIKTITKGLSVVFGTHPNDLVAGEPLTLEFLLDGEPVAGVEVEVIKGQTRYRNSKQEQKLKTNQDGKVTVSLPDAGMYWLDADYKDDHVSSKVAKERTLSYVLTLEVLPQ